MSTQIDITENSENKAQQLPEVSSKNSHGHKPRERRDIASGELRNPADMLRLVFGPDGQVVADIYQKLPGRGVWVDARRQSVEKAVKSGAIARAAKRKIILSDDFVDAIELGLAKRVLGMIGMAKRAGQLESGFENVRSCARSGKVGVRIEASDGKPDGRSKIRVVVKAIAKELDMKMPPIVGCFTGSELGKTIGRDNLVHACIHKGKMANAIAREIDKLAGFRKLLPDGWPDREHERVKTADIGAKNDPNIGYGI